VDQAARYSVRERTRDFPDGNVLTGFTIKHPLDKFRELEDQLDFLDFISFSDK